MIEERQSGREIIRDIKRDGTINYGKGESGRDMTRNGTMREGSG